MTGKKIRLALAVTVALAGSMVFAPPASAAPDCRGASGIIRCNSDRISCFIGGEWRDPRECV